MGLLTLGGAVLPVSQAWVARLIVDSVVDSTERHLPSADGLRAALPWLTAEFGLLLVSVAITQFRRWAEEVLDHKLSYRINVGIIRKALNLDLSYFEDSEFYDKLQSARRQSEYRAVAIMNAGFLLAQNTVTVASFAALILAFNPWVVAVLFGATLPAFIAQTRYSRLTFRLQGWQVPESRRIAYYEHLLTVDQSAKEIRLFNLGEPLLERHGELFWKIFREDQRLALRRSWASVGWGVIASLSFYLCYGWVILRTAARAISLGQMTFYLASFRQLQGTFSGLFDNVNRLYENGLFMQNLFEFLDLPERRAGPEGAGTGPGADAEIDLAAGIEFRRVSFRYPNSPPDDTRWALRDVSFTVRPGEKVALVGENGSGKTTLMKLLTRLYEPTEGEILLHGRNLRDYDAAELHRRIGVIFQDFVRYQLSLRENVGFGSIDSLADDERLARAIAGGGAQDVVEGLPDGLETMLGGWFQKGRELSGGQWQKIALSRAFMRESEVLVLDEPTSALDAAREHEIFARFKELTRGRIAFLVSHRFSTVRMADQIVVLRDGRIEERGTHAELMAIGGTYAHLFELQAQGYR